MLVDCSKTNRSVFVGIYSVSKKSRFQNERNVFRFKHNPNKLCGFKDGSLNSRTRRKWKPVGR